MRGISEVFAITCKHRDFPLSRRLRATSPKGEGVLNQRNLSPPPQTRARLLLDFREERRELSPLCPEVCGACPREGVTS